MRGQRVASSVALVILSLGVSAVPGHVATGAEPFTSVKFADVPMPGMPWGMVIHRGRVLTSTGGAFTEPLAKWYVFSFDKETGRDDPSRAVEISPPRPVSFMGLAGMAFDGKGRLYIADMNGRVLRAHLGTKKWEVYATIPLWSTGEALTDMPFDVAFDRSGNLYVADGSPPIIWRVPPGPAGRQAEVWLQDLRFNGLPLTTGIRSLALSPDKKTLYFGQCQYREPDGLLQSRIFRVPIDSPSSESVEVFHAYPSGPACPNGLAFGESGKLYASLTNADAIQVLKPNGEEERRFEVDPAPDTDAAPTGIALDDEGTLYIASMDTDMLFRASVGDPGHRLVRPRFP